MALHKNLPPALSFRAGSTKEKLVQPFQDSMSVGEEALMPLCMHSMSQNPRIRVEVYEYAEVVYSSIQYSMLYARGLYGASSCESCHSTERVDLDALNVGLACERGHSSVCSTR